MNDAVNDNDRYDLDRFVSAQGGGTYEMALAEIRSGQKRTHWMWFVFPQLRGLGRSPMAEHFGVTGLDEAKAYLAHPVLGPRLAECVTAVLESDADDAVEVFGGTDTMKLRSSVTLFARAAAGGPLAEQLQAVLDRWFDGNPDRETLRRT